MLKTPPSETALCRIRLQQTILIYFKLMSSVTVSDWLDVSLPYGTVSLIHEYIVGCKQ